MMLLITATQQIHRIVLQKIVLQRTQQTQHHRIVLQKIVHQRIILLTAQITHQIVDSEKEPAANTVGFFSFAEYNIKKRIL